MPTISPPGQVVLTTLSLVAAIVCLWGMISTIRTIVRIRRMGPEVAHFADRLWIHVVLCFVLFVVNLLFFLHDLNLFWLWPLEAARSYTPPVGPER